MRRSIFPCFLGSIFCKLLFHMFPESIKNETRKLFHYYLYTEPDLLRTGVKWLIGVSNIMQIEDHVRENKHVIHVHVYDQQLYFLEEKGIFSPVKVRIFVRCFSVAITTWDTPCNQSLIFTLCYLYAIITL